jgi:Zn-dependent metalloprotease
MKKLILLAVFTATSLFCFAQNVEQKTIIQKSNKGTIESVEFSSTDKSVQIPASAEVFFKDLLKIQKEDRFEKIPHKSKREGFIHEHLDQYYKGIKVDGAGYNFHYKNGEMFFAHGHYVKIENLNVEPAITECLIY